MRYALRGFRKNPGFTAAVLIVLALGIGANAAIFTVVNAVLLKPLPYKDSDRLVMVWHVPPPAMFPGRTQFAVSAANYLDWERRQHVFTRMAVHQYKTYTLTGRGQAELLRAQSVSAGFFDVLGVRPIEGRWFLPGEDEPGREPVVILSHRLWQTRFGGDRAIVGSRVTLDGLPVTVVGIMGPAFTFPDWAQLWTPLVWTEKERAVRSEHSLMVVARLAPGVDVQQAQAEMARSREPSNRSTRKTTRGGAQSWCRCVRTSSATCGRRCSSCSARWRSSCSSRARTSRTSCSPAPLPGAARWPSAWRSAPVRAGSCGRC